MEELMNFDPISYVAKTVFQPNMQLADGCSCGCEGGCGLGQGTSGDTTTILIKC